jgi:hypothetical protein
MYLALIAGRSGNPDEAIQDSDVERIDLVKRMINLFQLFQ